MTKNNVERRREHEAVRNNVGFYDFTHQLVVAKGPSAGAFLDKMFPNSIGASKPGDGVYTQMLDEDGLIIDDIVVFRLEEELFWITTLYAKEMCAHFDKYSAGYDVQYAEKSDTALLYAVQGPNSARVINSIAAESIDDLDVFKIKNNKIDNVDVKIARVGYTGELGYELLFAPEHRDFIVSKLNEAGAPINIVELKTDVTLTSLPAEKGYIVMRDIAGTNPMEAGFGWAVDWNTDFVGKPALEKAREAGVTRKLVGFSVEDDNAEAAEGDEIRLNGKTAGKVTNFTYAYTVESNVGYALIDTTVAKIGDKVTIISGNKEIEATLTKRVIYDTKDERRKVTVSSAVV